MSKLGLFIFIDGFGWDALCKHPYFMQEAVHKKPLETVLGYSSACDPSIITGKYPSEHGLWSSYFYSPATSPFKKMSWLQWLPRSLTDSARVRNRLSKYVAKACGFSGYYQLYNVPFQHMPLFDYAERNWIWGTRNSIPGARSIFELMLDKQIPFYVKEASAVTEEEQWQAARQKIQQQEIRFAYLLLGKVDGLMHQLGTEHLQVDRQIELYNCQIQRLIYEAQLSYEEVNWYVFSDHGMHDVHSAVDLEKSIGELGLHYGSDYIAFYDSTMARFWFLHDRARLQITQLLSQTPNGRILPYEELQELGVYFPDNKYGERIFLVDPGFLLVPSYMGRKKIAGMHGYHPREMQAKAMLCASHKVPDTLQAIPQLYSLMLQNLD